MTANARFPGFYRGAINLWVEDSLTRDYLRKVWNDNPAILFYVGGGNQGVIAVLEEAELAGLHNVFAFIDRDFGVTNRQNWADPQREIKRFVSSVHEIENHLLDADALAGCTLNTAKRTAAEIDDRLRQHAIELSWWMATRSVIAETRRTVLEDFPNHPTAAVVDQQTAEAFLLSKSWWNNFQTYSQTLTTADLENRLLTHHATVLSWIENGNWRNEFPGKELFRRIRSWVYTKPTPGATPATQDSDLAKDLGEWQLANNRVPPELSELLTALKTRAGVN